MSEDDSLRRVHVIVRGQVQGVAFRTYTAEAARRAGVAGWVRNRDDGSVEAVLEGPREAVAAALALVGRGPRFARVDGVEVRDEPARDERGFAIRH